MGCAHPKSCPHLGRHTGSSPWEEMGQWDPKVVFCSEALTLEGESTPGLLEAPGAVLQEEALEPRAGGARHGGGTLATGSFVQRSKPLE